MTFFFRTLWALKNFSDVENKTIRKDSAVSFRIKFSENEIKIQQLEIEKRNGTLVVNVVDI